MTQSIKCLFHKHKDMSLTRGTHIKAVVMMYTHKFSVGDGESGVCWGTAGQSF